MSTTSKFSMIGCVHKFLLAAERAGFTPETLNLIAEDATGILKDMLAVAEGRAQVRYRGHFINMSTEAKPVGYCVPQLHLGGGMFEWTPDSVTLVQLTFSNKKHPATQIAESALNANLLEYLLQHQELIPWHWRQGSRTFYFGTVYLAGGCNTYRGIYYRSGKWDNIFCDSLPNGPRDVYVCKA